MQDPCKTGDLDGMMTLRDFLYVHLFDWRKLKLNGVIRLEVKAGIRRRLVDVVGVTVIIEYHSSTIMDSHNFWGYRLF